MSFSCHFAVVPFFCAILTNRSSFFQRIYHALFIHSHELTHSPLIQSYSVCSPLSLSPSLPEGFSEAGTHDSHSLPFANPHTHIDRLFIHFPPSQTHSQHTQSTHVQIRHDKTAHTPHTQLSEQLTPPAHSLSDSVTFFSHGDKTVLQSLCLHSALIFSLFLSCTHTCTRSILEEAYVKFL